MTEKNRQTDNGSIVVRRSSISTVVALITVLASLVAVIANYYKSNYDMSARLDRLELSVKSATEAMQYQIEFSDRATADFRSHTEIKLEAIDKRLQTLSDKMMSHIGNHSYGDANLGNGVEYKVQ